MRERRALSDPAGVGAPAPDGSARLRLWCACLAVGVAAFAAYISLVPFNFRMPSDGWSLALSRELEMRVGISGNFLANGIMLLPFGFFGAGALLGPRAGTLRKAIAAMFILLLSVALSVSIEALQVFVPGRTPSLGDVTAQTGGTIAGLIAWFVLGRDVRVWSARLSSGTADALRLLLAGYAAISAFSLLHPLDVTVDLGILAHRWRTGRVVLNPLQSSVLAWDGLPAIISDFVLAVPLGAFAALVGTAPGTRRSAVHALAIGMVFFGLGELAQVFVQSRTADTFEFLVNSAGMAAGVWLVATMVGRRADAAPQSSALVPVGALVCCAGLYVAYNWSPYNFTITAATFSHRFEPLLAPPFRGYYTNPDFKALGDILVKTAMTLPIGIFLERWIRFGRTSYRRLVMAAVFVVGAAFFGAVELGQVFLPSRYPDDTDVLLALGGVWLGIRVARPFDRPVQRAATAELTSLDRAR